MQYFPFFPDRDPHLSTFMTRSDITGRPPSSCPPPLPHPVTRRNTYVATALHLASLGLPVSHPAGQWDFAKEGGERRGGGGEERGNDGKRGRRRREEERGKGKEEKRGKGKERGKHRERVWRARRERRGRRG